jgi:hypothetical protein
MMDWYLWMATDGTFRWAAAEVAEQPDFNWNYDGNAIGYRESPDGTAQFPAYTYAADNDTGQYRVGANNEGFSAAGVLRWDYNTSRMRLQPGYLLDFGGHGTIGGSPAGITINTDLIVDGDISFSGGLTFSEEFLAIDGTEVFPAYSFASTPNTGMYLQSPGVLSFTAGAQKRLGISTVNITAFVPLLLPSGTQAAPSLAFEADPNSGLFSPGIGQLAIANDNVALVVFGDDNVTFGAAHRVGWSSVASALATQDVVLLREAADILALGAGDSFHIPSGGLGVGVVNTTPGTIAASVSVNSPIGQFGSLGTTPIDGSNVAGTIPDEKLSPNVLTHPAGYPGGTTTFLRADGTFVIVPISGGVPGLHALTHLVGGTDPINVLSLVGYPGGTTAFLRADGTFAVPPGSTGGAPGAHAASHYEGGADAITGSLTPYRVTLAEHLVFTLAGGPLFIAPSMVFQIGGTAHGYMHASGGFSWGTNVDPGIGNLRVGKTIVSGEGARIMGQMNYAIGGPALELGYWLGTAQVQGYDRTGAAYIPLRFAGSAIQFNSAGAVMGNMFGTGGFAWGPSFGDPGAMNIAAQSILLTGMLRAQGQTVPLGATGPGVEIMADGQTTYVHAYNRTTSNYSPLLHYASVHGFLTAGATRMYIHATGGVAIGPSAGGLDYGAGVLFAESALRSPQLVTTLVSTADPANYLRLAGGSSAGDSAWINLWGDTSGNAGLLQISAGPGGGPIYFYTRGTDLRGQISGPGGFLWGAGAPDPGVNNMYVVGNVRAGSINVASTITSNMVGAILTAGNGGTVHQHIDLGNASGVCRFGIENSGGQGLLSGSLPYSGILMTSGAYALEFGTAYVSRMRIQGDGAVYIAGPVGIKTLPDANFALKVHHATDGVPTAYFGNAAANPLGVLFYHAADPNGGGNAFWTCQAGASVNKAKMAANGGLHGFFVYNTDLSDASMKTVIEECGSYREAFRRLHIVRGRYKDAIDDVNHDMVVAQEVEKVFPDLVTWFDEPKKIKGVRTHELMMRAFKVIQELDDDCTELRAQISQLKGKQ